MKRLLLFFLLLFFHYNFAYSQDKIEGIGKFKVGKTTISILTELEQELDTKLSPIPKNLPNINKSNIFEVEAKYPDLRIIKITKYSIANIDIKYFSIMFYKDTLCSIRIEGQDARKLNFEFNTEFKESYRKFVDAFEAKYGIPETKSSEKTSEECPSEKELVQLMVWKNESVVLQATQSVTWYKTGTFNTKCEPYTISGIDCYLTDNHPLMKSWSDMIKGPSKKQTNSSGKKVNLKDL